MVVYGSVWCVCGGGKGRKKRKKGGEGKRGKGWMTCEAGRWVGWVYNL